MNRLFKIFGIVFLALLFGVGSAIAETHSTWMTKHGYNEPGENFKGVFYQSGLVDCNDTKYFKSGVTNGDIINLTYLPANTLVKSIGIMVTRAAIKSGTSAEVGDGADADGYIGNDYTSYSIPYVDLANATSGISIWAYKGPITGGAGFIIESGVSHWINETKGTSTWAVTHNYGPYFTNASGISPYISAKSHIDMTVYVDKTASAGVTPAFKYLIECVKLPVH